MHGWGVRTVIGDVGKGYMPLVPKGDIVGLIGVSDILLTYQEARLAGHHMTILYWDRYERETSLEGPRVHNTLMVQQYTIQYNMKNGWKYSTTLEGLDIIDILKLWRQYSGVSYLMMNWYQKT